nr:Phage protein [Escherichia phage vB_Eco_NicPhage]
MNYTNFERKYVSNGIAGSSEVICLWKHENGTVCEIEQCMTPNYVYMRFENGITVSITMEGSNFKIALDDDFRQRDLGIHPCWNGVNRKLLVKTWIRHILSNRAKPEHLEAIFDVVLNEFDI